MTTLHMDVSAMRAIQRELEEVASQIKSQLAILRRNNQILQGDWVANSANEYNANYSELDARLNKIAQSLGAISSDLSAEISNYESIDKTFG